MSADNGIYIGHFKGGEIRVIHAQAIDNLWYPDGENAEYIVSYFKDSPVFTDIDAANKHAFKMEDAILSDDMCPILEYGVNTIRFGKTFKQYERAWKKQQKFNKEHGA